MSEFSEHVHDQLLMLGEVRRSRFFGGTGFKLGDLQFAMCMGDTLYFVVDEVTRPGYVEAGSGPFSYATSNGRRLVHRYYEVPGEVIEDGDALVEWARRSVAAAMTPAGRARRRQPAPARKRTGR